MKIKFEKYELIHFGACKLIFSYGEKQYRFYHYFGNPSQDFIVDEKDNIINPSGISAQIMQKGYNYIFEHYEEIEKERKQK